MTCSHYHSGLLAALLVFLCCGMQASAADWSTTELQYQYGNLKKPFQGGGSDANTGGTRVLTFQHASGWKYGDTFFFIDYDDYGHTDYEKENGLSETSEFYGELYPNFSLGKISGRDLSFGLVKDIGFLAGFNFAPEVDTFYWLPGIRLSLDLPGFAFANLDTMAYIQDDASNTAPGVSVDEDDSWMMDFNWNFPFSIGKTQWTIEGHMEYIFSADSETTIQGDGVYDGKRESWFLAQPQVRMDIGALWAFPDTLFGGIEYQYWNNKQGDNETTENVVQALLVWRL